MDILLILLKSYFSWRWMCGYMGFIAIVENSCDIFLVALLIHDSALSLVISWLLAFWISTMICFTHVLNVFYVFFCHAVVILVPTRELALQTSQVCKELGKHLKIQVMVTTGGTSLKDDILRLYQPVHLLVGTPGRILDLTKKGVCILKDCAMLVMDEVNTFHL